MKFTVRSPLRQSVLSALVRPQFSAGALPSFTVSFVPLTNSTGTVVTSAFINP